MGWQWTARPDQLPPDGDWFTWLILAGRGFGKALDVDTRIPTPSGWTTMGALSVGDLVFDECGNPCRVTATYDQPDGEAYRVMFSDGTYLDACAEHLWVTWTHQMRKQWYRAGHHEIPDSWALATAPITTARLRETLTYGKRQDVNHCIPVTMPLQTSDAKLPIHPYVMGAWLGDGDSAGSTLTSADPDILEFIRACGEPVGEGKTDNRSRAVRYYIGRRDACRCQETGRMLGNGSLATRLRELDVIHNKHVPAAYMRASASQRLELLQGLMDTDGYASSSHVEFCSTTKCLADAVVEIARSLGQKPVLREKQAKLDGRVIGPAYTVRWRPTLPVFKLQRKLAKVRDLGSQQGRNRHRMVESVEPIGHRRLRCISVDSPSAMYLAGDGMIPTHNTRTGAETTIEVAREAGQRIALVGRTAADVRDVMVQGESGILAVSPPDFRPRYLPSQRRLVWPNGSIATTYSGDKPDQLRGPQHSWAWCDELAAWRYPDSWDQLMFGLRLGQRPRAVATTTPRPTKLIRELIKRDTTHVTRGSTFANRANLADNFIDEMRKRYEGTRLGRQELEGEVLDDNPGALWSYGLLDRLRWRAPDILANGVRPRHPALRRVVIGVDPAVSSNEHSDETGIVVAGLGTDGHLYVLDDLSGVYTPHQWALAVAKAARIWNADCAVCEVNNGGDLVEANIRTVTQRLRVLKVHAAHGKYTRAEPVSSIYERGMAHHCGTLAKLETQMCEWNPKTDDDSPDRVDALVWALTELSGINATAGSVRRSA